MSKKPTALSPPAEAASAAETKHEALLERSRAIVRTVEAMQARGEPINEKARMDYLLAKAMLQRAASARKPPPAPAAPARNPADHPQEFATAVRQARRVIRVVEGMAARGETLSDQAVEEYQLALRFLESYDLPRRAPGP